MGKTDKISHKKVKGEKMEYRSVSLPTSLVEDLAILRECYEDTWFPVKEEDGPRKKRKAVSYEKVFERILSKSGLGHVDPDVYQEFIEVRKTRKSFPDVVKRSTRKAVEELADRAQENGTSLKEEARNAQEEARENLEKVRAGIPYIDPHSPIDSVLTDMAGTAAVPTDQELQEDPRLQEAYGEKEKVKERHQLQYFFVKGENRLPARFSKGPGTFAVTFEDRPRGVTFMTNRGWHLEDELGNIVDNKTATDIKREYENSQSTNNTILVISEQYSDEDMAAWAGISVEEYNENFKNKA